MNFPIMIENYGLKIMDEFSLIVVNLTNGLEVIIIVIILFLRGGFCDDQFSHQVCIWL